MRIAFGGRDGYSGAEPELWRAFSLPVIRVQEVQSMSLFRGTILGLLETRSHGHAIHGSLPTAALPEHQYSSLDISEPSVSNGDRTLPGYQPIHVSPSPISVFSYSARFPASRRTMRKASPDNTITPIPRYRNAGNMAVAHTPIIVTTKKTSNPHQTLPRPVSPLNSRPAPRPAA